MFAFVAYFRSVLGLCEYNLQFVYLYFGAHALDLTSATLRYESSTHLLYKELSSTIFQSLSVRHR